MVQSSLSQRGTQGWEGAKTAGLQPQTTPKSPKPKFTKQ